MGRDHDWASMVVVGRVARPHGLKGHVVVNPETDFIDERFAPGSVLWTEGPEGPEPLRVADAKLHGSRPVVGFEGFTRVEDAGRLAGRELRIPETLLQPLDAGRYYEHQLAGCAVETTAGQPVGTVKRLEGNGGNVTLVIEATSGEVLIPFAADICRTVNPAARRIVIEPPEGLLELNEVKRRGSEVEGR